MKTILFEYDFNLSPPEFLNYSPGVWKITLTPAPTYYVDDRGVTGTYRYTNDIAYNVQSVIVDNSQLAEASSLSDCTSTDGSFFYDSDTTVLYIHFTDSETPDGKIIYAGSSVGYSYSVPENNYPYYDGREYQPRVTKISNIKKQIDRTYYGRLNYQGLDVSFINNDGHFDGWREQNAFGSRSRILYGAEGAVYDDLITINEGNISDDSRSWTEFQLNISDQRQEFTSPIASRILTADDYPDMNTDYIDEVVPVHAGKVFESDCIPLDEGTAPSATYTFIFTDTTNFSVSSLDAVYVNGAEVTPASTSLANGTFSLDSADVVDEWSNVTATFTMDNKNGVDIITDFIAVYDGRDYLASWWDLTETNAAKALARNTSLTVDSSDTKLSEVIEQVANDISGRFFVKDNGKFTIRLYDADREIDHVIERDAILSQPEIKNNGSEFLSSCTIKYQHNIRTDEWLTYQETAFETETASRYKKTKNEEYETGLYTRTDAIAKAADIMRISAEIEDIVTVTVSWDSFDIELCDFIAFDPVSRYSEPETKKVYEVLGVEKDIENFVVKLTLRYVKDYQIDTYEYSVLVDDTGDFIVDSEGTTIAIKEFA